MEPLIVAPRMEPLIDWITAKGFTQDQFARRVGLTQGHLSRYLNGRIRISPETAQRIVIETAGVFSLEFLLRLEPVGRPMRPVRRKAGGLR